jgi:hypothetical protein
MYCLFCLVAIGFINFSVGLLISYVVVPILLLGSYYPTSGNKKTRLESLFTCFSIAVLVLYAYEIFSIRDSVFSFLTSASFEILHYGIIFVIIPAYILSWRISLQALVWQVCIIENLRCQIGFIIRFWYLRDSSAKSRMVIIWFQYENFYFTVKDMNQ